jgi:hypothetical protein
MNVFSTKGNELQPVRRWVPGKLYAAIHNIHPQTLANWRHFDLRAGRACAPPGYPQYKRFGKAVRYLLEETAA